jgi:hypothetical protein
MQEQVQPPKERKRRVYFRPGQVLMLVEHPPGFATENIVAQIEERYFSTQLRKGAKIDPRRVLSFLHNPALLSDDTDTPVEERRRPLRPAFSLLFVDTPEQKARQLIDLIEALNDEIKKNRDKELNTDLVARAAAPDWLSTPSPQNVGGGGPGARPRGFTSTDGTIPYKFKPDLEPRQQAHAVEVAILDTAPTRVALAQALIDYPQHPLLPSLLDKLTISYAGPLGIRLPTPDELRVKDHDYLMSDHGLFVAGIIHQIAPEASLRLFEVLNEYGVGSIEGIARALTTLRDERAALGAAAPKLVINMSLTVVTPLPGQRKLGGDAEEEDELKDWRRFDRRVPKLTKKDLTEEEKRQARAALQEIQELDLALDWVCASMTDANTVVVASSGNDAVGHKDVDGDPRPQARLPAAFPEVLGVAALLKDSSYASYSNRPDQPEAVGLATFGGDARFDTRVPNQPIFRAVPCESVLGVYIGRFPTRNPNRTLKNYNGWGWWAGTSFAAPQISGKLADLIQLNGDPQLAVEQLRARPDGNTDDGGEVVKGTQVA